MSTRSNNPLRFNRRRFLLNSAVTAGGIITTNLLSKSSVFAQAPALITSNAMRPSIPYGVATGDMGNNGIVIWSRSDRPARMLIEYSTSESFNRVGRVLGPITSEEHDYTGRFLLKNLPPDQQIFYRVTFQDLDNSRIQSEPVSGTFRTPSTVGRDILFVWGGDTAGQGWGINPDFGGMKIYETMRQLNPDFFIHCGDTVYVDNPIVSERTLEDGTIWRNITTEEKSKVAETLQEFRGNFQYNLLDDNVKRFNAEVPMLAQWDDHETTNNWYPGEILQDSRYVVKDVNLLAERARQAFFEYMPMNYSTRFGADSSKIYRSFQHGPLLDIFMLDERTYRGPNTQNVQPKSNAETVMLGRPQLKWLKKQLLESKATWKVISSDMPLGLIVRDGPSNFEAWANADNGRPLGRELELAELLRFIKRRNIENVVWITADVHYAAAHYYDPSKAEFTDFKPFWEFVAGPLNSGTFGPGQLENTFGPQLMFQSNPPGMRPNRPPSEGLQFFGAVKIDADTKVMTISLRNLVGEVIYTKELTPES
ncbi:alkaline phosphatase D family protein [Umezakia ovalisporum]|uniref:Alkaline phosphatase D family protein n=2 Tax=Umezakia ovalisporum TaxID=75695 RepID=A0AA43GZY2_9CYAN|nr:alkaline phosphatase D family protein [Umezakia ovalisporum]MDH6055430.1 alkaline phosphatase D family protein [Umezakia ovalisporum FSS-43]MDH6064130.1 alkaline phosphatase D family protein [Umezakia ovalisporum FSS-62]MDH6068497.1 alkaline phosphatase D family protein [Umezakia ovalisporum APH033B]MDH6069972.1 alkaline phosphatase D family protein [Umezakia ovalisporum CobakiLakeA]MDH6075161.1 alkaline phosphatase D family protein [Umezakia ovalisporum CS-1034]